MPVPAAPDAAVPSPAQYEPRGVSCREAVNECDIPESCTGDSSQVSREWGHTVGPAVGAWGVTRPLCPPPVPPQPPQAGRLLLRERSGESGPARWDVAVGLGDVPVGPGASRGFGHIPWGPITSLWGPACPTELGHILWGSGMSHGVQACPQGSRHVPWGLGTCRGALARPTGLDTSGGLPHSGAGAHRPSPPCPSRTHVAVWGRAAPAEAGVPGVGERFVTPALCQPGLCPCVTHLPLRARPTSPQHRHHPVPAAMGRAHAWLPGPSATCPCHRGGGPRAKHIHWGGVRVLVPPRWPRTRAPKPVPSPAPPLPAPQGRCYGGRCKTRDRQCNALWGRGECGSRARGTGRGTSR